MLFPSVKSIQFLFFNRLIYQYVLSQQALWEHQLDEARNENDFDILAL